MKIGVLTSSRADFGIYTPLLAALHDDENFELDIIAFGTHLSERHGYTINEIKSRGYGNIIPIETKVEDTTPAAVANSYADALAQFSFFWPKSNYDLVLCLGDRYEMSAAIQAGIPFGIKYGHFHGGETTLGAIDNIYRHQITLASSYHFASTLPYTKRIEELTENSKKCIFHVGSLSLSGLENAPILERSVLLERFNLPEKPYILSTFHPETVNFESNKVYVNEMIAAFKEIPDTHHLIVTMPNADTNGTLYRDALHAYQETASDKITLIESFGKDYYFSALKHADFVLGNSSSAIIEAASFGQYVINVGDRQKGRLQSENTMNCPFNKKEIITAINALINKGNKFAGENIYVRSGTVVVVMDILRKIAYGEI